MSGEKDLEQIKREAAEKAKELAKQRLAAKQSGEGNDPKQAAEAIAKPEVKADEVQASGEDADLAKKKAAAAAKAKAAALAKMKATGQAEEAPAAPEVPAGEEDADLAKKKAAAAAKAKAAALAKMKATGQEGEGAEAPAGDDDADLAKKKAAAVAKAKAAAAAKAKAAGGDASSGSADDEKAKAIAAAKAKAAAAMKAKAAAGEKAGAEEPVEEKKPSPNQPYLDKYVKVITDNLGADVLEDAYINPLSKDVPTLVAKKESYHRVAAFLKYNELLGFDYLSELHGTDFQTHMEVYVHLYSYKNRQSVALKVKLDRDNPVTESVQPLWAGADWPECETYDLLGIKFEGHPNLHRIMLGEDWVGHPLRKDYEPYDVEV